MNQVLVNFYNLDVTVQQHANQTSFFETVNGNLLLNFKVKK